MQAMPYVRTANLVCTATFSTQFSRDLLCDRWQHLGVEYNSVLFPAVKRRFNDPSCCVLLFYSGKAVISGCKTNAECRYYMCVVARDTREAGFEAAHMCDLGRRNGVTSFGPFFPLDLDALARKHTDICEYDPDVFPGAIIKLSYATILAFRSGRFVVPGPATIVSSFSAQRYALKLAEPFRADVQKQPPSTNGKGSMQTVHEDEDDDEMLIEDFY